MEPQTRPRRIKTAYIVVAVLAGAIAGGVYIGDRHRAREPRQLETHSMTWYESPRIMARLFLDRYGPPDAYPPGAAAWYHRKPWKRISVYGHSPDRYLEQAVDYRARPGAAALVREFGCGALIDGVREELSAVGDSQSRNLLTLNLADEVAAGKRTPRDARALYLRTDRLTAAGKSSLYMEKLLFQPHGPAPRESSARETRRTGP